MNKEKNLNAQIKIDTKTSAFNLKFLYVIIMVLSLIVGFILSIKFFVTYVYDLAEFQNNPSYVVRESYIVYGILSLVIGIIVATVFSYILRAKLKKDRGY